MNDEPKVSRRDFIEGTLAAATVGAVLHGCHDGSGASGDTPPFNVTPIPAEQLTTMPADPYDDRRVVRVYDRRVTSYAFRDDQVAPLMVDAAVARAMLEVALCELSRERSVEAAWTALLPGPDLGGARIAVKVNLNGDEPEFVNTSPAMVVALAQSLVDVGVEPEAITFFDRSRDFHAVYRSVIEAALPGVALLGRDEVSVDEDRRVEAPSLVLPSGGHVSVPAPTCLLEADHLVNLHVLKGHFGGATGAMKNLFGLARNVYDTFHGRDDWGLARYERGRQCADLASQPLVREKSRLLIAEAIYGTWWHANKPPDRFRYEALFPGGLPCSLVVGRNPLHHDLVLFDLLRAERDAAALEEGYGFYPDDWLVSCAEEPYGLGVFEHGSLVDGVVTEHDLSYASIDYRTLTT